MTRSNDPVWALPAPSAPGRLIAIWLLVAAVLAVVYLPALGAGFVWDDDDHFTSNPYLEKPDGIVTIWTSSKAIYYPLTLSTWWVLRRTVGLEPFAYHLVTLLLHAANAVLLWRLLGLLRVPGCWLAAAIFLLHPMQVESVAWATELKNTQSGFFFFLALILYRRWLDDGSRIRYGGALLAFIAALLSKPSVTPLPGVLVVLMWWSHGRVSLRQAGSIVPFLLGSIASAVWTIMEQKYHSNARGPEWDFSLLDRLMISGGAFFFYLGKLLWPDPLIFIYPRWNLAEHRALLISAAVACAAVPALLAAFVVRGDRPVLRHTLAAWLLYGGLLFPVLGFFNIYFQRFSFVADHFAYLALAVPIAGLCAALVTAVGRWIEPELRRMALALPLLLMVILSGLSYRQTRIYHDEETLWRATLELNPSAWIGWNNLGYLLAEQGRFNEAIPHFEKAIELKPEYEEAWNNLGWSYLELDRAADAIAPLQEAVRHRVPYPAALVNLGNALAMTGRMEEALLSYAAAMEAAPADVVGLKNYGSVLLMSGRKAEALAVLTRARTLAPEDADLERRWRAAGGR